MTNTAPTLREWLEEAPFGLTLSSGFFAFYAHCGFLTALEEAGVMPTRISGSSAGALAGGAWASGLAPSDLRDELFRLRREDFWDPAPGLGLLRGRRFAEKLRHVLHAETFSACRCALAVSAFDALGRRTRVIDSGPLAPAIQASCSVPLLFQPVWINKRPHFDGGVGDRHGLAGMPSDMRVLYHHIVSRSPWRRPGSPSLAIPQRQDMVTVAIEGLPRVDPFRLPRGPLAYQRALDATRSALRRPATGVVRI